MHRIWTSMHQELQIHFPYPLILDRWVHSLEQGLPSEYKSHTKPALIQRTIYWLLFIDIHYTIFRASLNTKVKKGYCQQTIIDISNSAKINYHIAASLEQNPITPPNSICNASEPTIITSDNWISWLATDESRLPGLKPLAILESAGCMT